MPRQWGKKPKKLKKKLSRDRVFSRSRFAMPEAHAQIEQRCGRRMSLTKMKSAEVSGAKCKKTVLVITHANTRRHQLDIPNAHPQRPASKQNVRRQTRIVGRQQHQLCARRVLGAAACRPPRRTKLQKRTQTLGAGVERTMTPSRATENCRTDSVREWQFSSTAGLTLLAGNGWPPSYFFATLRYLASRLDPASSDTAKSGPLLTRWVRPPLPLSNRLPDRFRPVYPGCGPPLRTLNVNSNTSCTN